MAAGKSRKARRSESAGKDDNPAAQQQATSTHMEKHTVRTSHTELTEEVKKTLQGKYHYHTHGVERSRFKILWSAVIKSPNQVGRALQRSRFASGARGLGEHVDSSSKPR